MYTHKTVYLINAYVQLFELHLVDIQNDSSLPNTSNIVCNIQQYVKYIVTCITVIRCFTVCLHTFVPVFPLCWCQEVDFQQTI